MAGEDDSERMSPLQPLQIEPAAVVQGVVVAVTVLGLSVVYFDRLSRISHNVGEMTESVASIEDEVTAVDLTRMERTLTKLDYTLDRRGEDVVHSGEGTVFHTLERTGTEVGISYVTTHPAAREDDVGKAVGRERDGPEVVVKVEFEDEVNVQALFDRLEADERLAEPDCLDGAVGVVPTSPFELVFRFPTDDHDTVAALLPEYLDVVDEHLADTAAETERIEARFEEQL